MAERLKIMYTETAFKTSFSVSIFMHLIIFTLASFIGPQIKHIHFSPIYQVKLVSPPVLGTKPQILKRKETIALKEVKTTKKRAIALVKAKKTKKAIALVKAKKSKVNKKSKIDVNSLVEAKVKQIEGRLAKERIEKAVARIAAKLKGSAVSVGPARHRSRLSASAEASRCRAGSGEAGGAYQGEVSDGPSLRFQIYYQEIWERIKNNWILPTFLLKGKAIEAIVIIKITKNGDIIDKFFEKKSGIPLFDNSVMEAISHSTPLPPLPEGYVLSYHELGIRFRWEKEK